MSAPKDGGPAFPYSVRMEGFDRMSASGMSLRDHFAGHALNGLYSMAKQAQLLTSDLDLDADAKLAYRIADAMLREREKGQ